MYRYLVAFVLFSPLLGIALVERGAFALTLGVDGSPNGATMAFAVYVLVVATVAMIIVRTARRRTAVIVRLERRSGDIAAQTEGRYRHFSIILLLVSLGFLLVMLIPFGGLGVWLGQTEKGAFRATLGPFGTIPYLMTKFVTPALFAYSTLLLTRTRRNFGNMMLWRVNLVVIFLVGATWGFKTAGMLMVLPALLILNWRMPVMTLIKFGAIFLLVLLAFFTLFDAALMDGVGALGFLFSRLTIMQGDVAWRVWGMYQDGEPLPVYPPTLLSAAGDRVLTLLGVSKDDYTEWMAYHYDWMLTSLAGAPIENITNGHSVTATPFAEGVIAGGVIGMMLFAVIGGVLVGWTYVALQRALIRGSALKAALLSTYFCFNIFPWLNGGAITQLFHVSVVFNILLTTLVIKMMLVRTVTSRRVPFQTVHSVGSST